MREKEDESAEDDVAGCEVEEAKKNDGYGRGGGGGEED